MEFADCHHRRRGPRRGAVPDVAELQRLRGEAAIGRPTRIEVLRLTEKRSFVLVPRAS